MRITLLILALGISLATGAGKVSITPELMTSWSIVCDPAATDSEHYAAAEFQRIFREMTGTTLPVSDKAAPNQGAVFIGPDAVTHSPAPAAAQASGEEWLRITVQPGFINLDGGRPRGTLYGVYEFFEERCGVRYLTFDHTYYPPKAATRQIPVGTQEFNPTFAFRWSYYGENSRYPEFAARLHVNTVSDDPKLGGRTGFRLVSHNVAYLVPPSKYGTEHPEYYALVAGQRKIHDRGGGPQLCMSNPDLVGVVTGAVLEEIKKNPTARNINIAQMDNEEFCTCPTCAAIDSREESHAGSTLAFVNAVAAEVEKTHPDVLISTYAYLYTRKPPKTLRPRSNVMIQLCSIECCDFHSIDDSSCPLNRSFCADMADWKKIAKNIFIWHYNTNFKGYLLPFPNLRSIGKSVAYFANNNGQGVFMQAAGNGFSTELSDLRNYVMSRCLWKPGRDSWKETEDFCKWHYAEASGPILKYLAYYHDLVDKARFHPACFSTESSLCITPESSRRIMGYFTEALALAKSEAVRARVEKASLCALRAALSTSSMRLAYRDGTCLPDLTGFDSSLLDNYATLSKRFGAVMDDEMITTEKYISGMRRLHNGLKAIRLENEFWRVVVLPESNGKVVEMTYKPTGRNVLRATRGFNRLRYEAWMQQGDGPAGDVILPFESQVDLHNARLTLTTRDGSQFQRSVSLIGDAVRFETSLTAGVPRVFDILEHPEFDTGTASTSPEIVGIYARTPAYAQINQTWKDPILTDEQRAAIRDSVTGGAFAFFNLKERFGVEERFDPTQFRSLSIFWEGSRQQINLQLSSKVVPLSKGQEASYVYEVRYLSKPPTVRSGTKARLH